MLLYEFLQHIVAITMASLDIYAIYIHLTLCYPLPLSLGIENLTSYLNRFTWVPILQLVHTILQALTTTQWSSSQYLSIIIDLNILQMRSGMMNQAIYLNMVFKTI